MNKKDSLIKRNKLTDEQIYQLFENGYSNHRICIEFGCGKQRLQKLRANGPWISQNKSVIPDTAKITGGKNVKKTLFF